MSKALPFVAAAACLASGCASQINNVFHDPGVSARGEMTTASAEGYTSSSVAWHEHRDWPPTRLEYHHAAVTHWPIWWEDPLVDRGNEGMIRVCCRERTHSSRESREAILNARAEENTPNAYVLHGNLGYAIRDVDERDLPDRDFAVTGADFLAIPVSTAQCLLNTIAWPVSAIVMPPGTVMASDGRISRQIPGYLHDATRVPHDTESPDRIRRESPQAATQPALVMPTSR